MGRRNFVALAGFSLLAATCTIDDLPEDGSASILAPPPADQHEAEPSFVHVERALAPAMARARYAFVSNPATGEVESGSTSWYARAVGPKLRFAAGASITGELPDGAATFETIQVGRDERPWEGGAFHASEGRLAREADGVAEFVEGSSASIEQSWVFDRPPTGVGDLVVRVAVSGGSFASSDASGLHFRAGNGGFVYGHATWRDAAGNSREVPSVWELGSIRMVVPAALLDQSSYPAVLDPAIGPEVETDAPIDAQSEGVSNDTYGAHVGCTSSTCLVAFQSDRGVELNGYELDGSGTPGYAHRIITGENVYDVGSMGGTFVLVTRVGAASPYTFRVRRIDAMGASIGNSTDFTSTGAGAGTGGKISCAPDRCLLTFVSANNVVGNRIALDGTKLDPAGFIIQSAAAAATDVGFNGVHFLASFTGGSKRIDLNGGLVDLTPLSASGNVGVHGTDFLVGGSLVHDDGTTAWTVAPFGSDTMWVGNRWLLVGGSKGRPLSDTGVFAAFDYNYGPLAVKPYCAALPGGGGLIVGNTSPSTYLTRVNADGAAVQATTLISDSANAQHRPFFIAGPSQTLLTWVDARLGGYGIYAQRYDTQGNALDVTPFLIANTTSVGSVTGTSDGVNYLVSYGDGMTAGRSRLVSTSGQLLGSELPIGGSNAVAVAFDGTYYFFVSAGAIKVQRMSPAGVIVDAAPIGLGVSGSAVRAAYRPGTGVVIAYPETGKTSAVTVGTGGTIIAGPTTITNTSKKLAIACSSNACLLSDGVTFHSETGNLYSAPSHGAAVGLPSIAVAGPHFMLVDAEPSGIAGIRMPGIGGSWYPFSTDPSAVEPSVVMFDGSHGLVAYERYVPVEKGVRLFVRALGPAALSSTCNAGEDCASGFCADGVCCNQACTGGNGDCQACSVAAGAAVNGVCGPRAAASVCRAASGGTTCDVAEVCDGVTTTCPADAVQPAMTPCRLAAGPCDAVEKCDGTTKICPNDAKEPSGVVCRPAATACDKAELCTGLSITCPNDIFSPATAVCRPATGPCDVPEFCPGGAPDCPADGGVAEGTTCGDPSSSSCDAPDSCIGTVCAANTVPDGTPCGGSDTCVAGVCTPPSMSSSSAASASASASSSSDASTSVSDAASSSAEASSGSGGAASVSSASSAATTSAVGSSGATASSGSGGAPPDDGGGCSVAPNGSGQSAWWGVIPALFLVRRRRPRHPT
ncbi:MAG: MYXO-CTERM sorting domain-containing protein [Polyangiaceae bacterium]